MQGSLAKGQNCFFSLYCKENSAIIGHILYVQDLCMEVIMKNKIKLKGSLKRYMRWPILMSLMLIAVNLVIFAIDRKAGWVLALATLVYIIVSICIYKVKRPSVLKSMIDFATEYGVLQRKILQELSVPYCILDIDGKILWYNHRFQDLFGDSVRISLNKHSISSVFSEISEMELQFQEKSRMIEVDYEGQYFQVELKRMNVADAFDRAAVAESVPDDYLMAVTFYDKTEIKHLIKENQEQRMVAGLIYIDNYDEALESIEDVRRSLLVALIDRKINKYISNVNGIVKKLEKDKYFIAVKQKYVSTMQSNKFALLDDVKTVNIGNKMPVTISIGLGIDGENYIQNCDFSRTAIDLALGRGGDQAVLKVGEKVYYYGGKSKSVEKNTRVKARIKAHALREILATKDKAIIMGHSIGDIDSLGAAIGIYRAIKTFEKKSHIVINTVTSSLRPMYERFSEEAGYEEDLFISSSEALDMIDDNTLVIVVDVNRPSYTECPELISKSKATVILDHHRQSSETISNAVLSYIEPYASSACEMVAEVLQYIRDNVKLTPQEADALYAGIMVDTNNFTNKTGVRTFEAAAFLKRNGADVIRVKKLFRDSAKEYKAKAEAIEKAEIFDDAFIITECMSKGLESPTVIGAQAANELLNIKDIRASFVVTEYNDKIYISARSIDDVNVQLIMERLGGGGHLNVAGAQLEGYTIDQAKEIVKQTVEKMKADGDF